MNKIPPRIRAFIFASLALISLVLLSASLNSLQLSAGSPLPVPQMAPKIFDPTIPSESLRWLVALLRLLLIIGWIGLPIYIILMLISKEERKRFLRNLGLFLPFFIIIYIVLTQQAKKNQVEELTPAISGGSSLGPAITPMPTPEYVPPAPWVTTFTTVAIALGIALALVAVFYILWRRTLRLQEENKPIKRVEREARSALDAISAGGDLREAVIRCYFQMIEALREYRGIRRDQDMTPHEFVIALENRGLPGEPVRQLTRLFEDVRYGTFTPGRKDEQVAIASLSAIISACQKIAERQGS